jgi:hypothetical protein
VNRKEEPEEFIVTVAVTEWLRLWELVSETTAESQKIAIPPRVSSAGRKTKSCRETPAISIANDLSMCASFVSWRHRIDVFAAAASSATAVRRAGMLRPLGFQDKMGQIASLIVETKRTQPKSSK